MSRLVSVDTTIRQLMGQGIIDGDYYISPDITVLTNDGVISYVEVSADNVQFYNEYDGEGGSVADVDTTFEVVVQGSDKSTTGPALQEIKFDLAQLGGGTVLLLDGKFITCVQTADVIFIDSDYGRHRAFYLDGTAIDGGTAPRMYKIV